MKAHGAAKMLEATIEITSLICLNPECPVLGALRKQQAARLPLSS